MFTLMRAFLFAYGGICAARIMHTQILDSILKVIVLAWHYTFIFLKKEIMANFISYYYCETVENNFWIKLKYFSYKWFAILFFFGKFKTVLVRFPCQIYFIIFKYYNAAVFLNVQRYFDQYLAIKSAQTDVKSHLKHLVKQECLLHVKVLIATLRWRTAIQVLFICFFFSHVSLVILSHELISILFLFHCKSITSKYTHIYLF